MDASIHQNSRLNIKIQISLKISWERSYCLLPRLEICILSAPETVSYTRPRIPRLQGLQEPAYKDIRNITLQEKTKW